VSRRPLVTKSEVTKEGGIIQASGLRIFFNEAPFVGEVWGKKGRETRRATYYFLAKG